MLEDKTDVDKAPKPGVGSPQSSILQFFISPNQANSKKILKPEESRTDNSQQKDKNKKETSKPEVVESDTSQEDSVILLSEDSSCKDDGGDLNVSRLSNRTRRPKLKDEVGQEREVLAEDEVIEVSEEVDKQDEESREVTTGISTSEKDLSDKSETIHLAGGNDVATSETSAKSDQKTALSNKAEKKEKKKRKRISSEGCERKRSKADVQVDNVPCDLNCSTEMSYEAFIQSISTPSRDVMADDTPPDSCQVIADNTPPGKEVFEHAAQKDMNLVEEKTKTKYIKKTARTSLFSEEGLSKSVDNDLAVLNTEEGEKTKKASILNFFSKVNASSVEKDHQVVTVMADVHKMPSKDANSNLEVASIFKPKPKVLSPRSPEVVELETNIEFLGSETVVDVSNKNKPKAKIKDKTEKAEKNSKEDAADDVKIEKVEAAPRAAEVDAFLKNSDSPAVPTKSAQATLSFTKAGLKTANMTSTPHNTRMRSETTEEKSKKSAKGKKKSKRTVEESKVDVDDPVLVKETKAPQGQRSRRVRYQVSSLQFDDSRQTPIKMKIRLKKNTSSGEESDFTPKSCKAKGVKQKKAQKILEKAKKVRKSKSSPKERKKRKFTSVVSDDSVVDLDSSVEGGRRRSARIKVMSPPAPIIVDEEIEIEEVPEKKTKGKKGSKTPLKIKAKDSPAKAKVKNSPMKVAKDSPRKAKIKNSPLKLAKNSPRKPKGNSKLAPIFMGKSNNEPVPPREPEDPEKVRLRQAFLMSDVPEALRKKAIATAAVQNIISENLGLPTVSHVQQKPAEDEGVWNLPSVTLPLRSWSVDVPSKPAWKDMTCRRVTPHLPVCLFKDFRCHAPLDQLILDDLLGEVESLAKGLSVRQMFTDMKQKLIEDLKAPGPGTTETIAQPEVVEEPEKKKGRGRKKKLSLNKEEVKAVPPPEVKIGEMMWSERYQPGHSSEVIGHTAHIQKLKSWLLEWKHRTHKEARKMRLQLLKQSCPKSSGKGTDEDNAWWGEDDSDFDMDSDDSEDEDDSLCNTMLITGPHGVGKTCTIYALAQELGYKVIEVNAASSRNGKKILSKLQEATQSHQVAASKDGNSSNMLSALSNTLSNSGLTLDSPKSTKKEAKLPTAFTNLFNKAAGNKTKPVEVIDLDADDKKSDQKKSRRKRKRDKDDEQVEKSPKKAKKEKAKPAQPMPVRDDTSQSGGLELSSTTLILFDEVEIYFDEDRGYLPAIQHFMTRTKIPIILTTTEPNFGSQLQARFESLVFKQPSLVTIASHLQTICLAESVRTCHSEMTNLVRLSGGDIRKCLLWLHYWLSSGGGSSKLNRALRKAPRSVISVEDNTQDSDSQGRSLDLDDDFVVKKTIRKRRVLDEDDSSNSAMVPDGEYAPQADIKSSHLPQVHSLQLEALAGISKPVQECLEQVIVTYLQGACDEHRAQELQEMCLNLHRMGLPVLSHNLIHLLPLDKTLLNIASNTPVSTATSSPKRSRIRTDLFDDEASNGSSQEVEEKKEETEEISSKEVKCLSYKSLEALSDYYETVCCVDVVASRTEECLISKCYSSHLALMNSNIGGTDSVADLDSPVMSLMEDAVVETQMMSARKLYTKIDKATEGYKREAKRDFLPDEVSLPVSGGRSVFSLMPSEPKLPSAARKAQENVTDCLPLAVHCNQRVVNLDYLPSLRGICRSEQYRQIAKTKRRFQHYFDNIGLPLKETTLNVLSQTFN